MLGETGTGRASSPAGSTTTAPKAMPFVEVSSRCFRRAARERAVRHARGAFTSAWPIARAARPGGRRDALPRRGRRADAARAVQFLKVLEEKRYGAWARCANGAAIQADLRDQPALVQDVESGRFARTSTSGSTCSDPRAGAARAPRGDSGAERHLLRSLGAATVRLARSDGAAARLCWPATCASCATRWSARCSCRGADRSSGRTSPGSSRAHARPRPRPGRTRRRIRRALEEGVAMSAPPRWRWRVRASSTQAAAPAEALAGKDATRRARRAPRGPTRDERSRVCPELSRGA